MIIMKKIKEIKEIRVHNNDLWMQILEIAVEVAPEKTRKILKGVKENDEKISKLLGEL